MKEIQLRLEAKANWVDGRKVRWEPFPEDTAQELSSGTVMGTFLYTAKPSSCVAMRIKNIFWSHMYYFMT